VRQTGAGSKRQLTGRLCLDVEKGVQISTQSNQWIEELLETADFI